jgi:hypothetical protein
MVRSATNLHAWRRLAIAVAAMTLMLSGCGGGGGDDGGSSEPPPPTTGPGALEVKATIKPSVMHFDPSAANAPQRVSTNLYHWDTLPSTVLVGTVFVHEGRARRVESIEPDGTGAKVMTSAPQLDEIYSELEIEGDVDVSQAQFVPFDDDEVPHDPSTVITFGSNGRETPQSASGPRERPASTGVKMNCSKESSEGTCTIEASDSTYGYTLTGKVGIRQLRSVNVKINLVDSVLKGEYTTFGEIEVTGGKLFKSEIEKTIPLGKLVVPLPVTGGILRVEVPVAFVAELKMPVGLRFKATFDREVKLESVTKKGAAPTGKIESNAALSPTTKVEFAVVDQQRGALDLGVTANTSLGFKSGLSIGAIGGIASGGVALKTTVDSIVDLTVPAAVTEPICWSVDSKLNVAGNLTASYSVLRTLFEKFSLTIATVAIPPLSSGCATQAVPGCTADVEATAVWANVGTGGVLTNPVTVSTSFSLGRQMAFTSVNATLGDVDSLVGGKSIGTDRFSRIVRTTPPGAEGKSYVGLTPEGASRLASVSAACKSDSTKASSLLPNSAALDACPKEATAPVFTVDLDDDAPVYSRLLKVQMRSVTEKLLVDSYHYTPPGFEAVAAGLVEIPNSYLSSTDPMYVDPGATFVIPASSPELPPEHVPYLNDYKAALACYVDAFSKMKASAKTLCASEPSAGAIFFCSQVP